MGFKVKVSAECVNCHKEGPSVSWEGSKIPRSVVAKSAMDEGWVNVPAGLVCKNCWNKGPKPPKRIKVGPVGEASAARPPEDRQDEIEGPKENFKMPHDDDLNTTMGDEDDKTT